MNCTLGALQKLSAETHVIRQRAALPPVNGQHACQQLRGTLDNLRQKRTVIKLDRPKVNVDAVWSKFAAARYDLGALDALQLRALCSAEETALRPEFVVALAESGAAACTGW